MEDWGAFGRGEGGRMSSGISGELVGVDVWREDEEEEKSSGLSDRRERERSETEKEGGMSSLGRGIAGWQVRSTTTYLTS